MSVTGDGFVPLRVASVEHDTDDSVVVTFDPGAEPLPFVHGQHLTLRREIGGVEVRRNYSICSPAGGPLRVAVRRVAGGAMSTWATTELRVGDIVDALAPSGHFTHELDPAAVRRYTALAAGSGITPILSIVATILAGEPMSRVSLVFVNRTSRSVMLIDELHDLLDRHLGRLRLTFAFTRDHTEGALLSGRPDRGRIDEWIRIGFLPADVDHAFLCGPFALIADVGAALEAAGMPAERIHRELFTADQVGRAHLAPQVVTEATPAIASGTARLHGRSTHFDVFEGDSVLDAVQRVRPDAPYSCRSGVCSTCQAVLRAGEVEMAVNYGLTAGEVERGYVLTCQSRPLTPELTVDYDA